MTHASKYLEIQAAENGACIVRFHALHAAVSACDVAIIDELSNELHAILHHNPTALILDFQGKEFLPVAAFEGKLLLLHKKLSGRLFLCALPTAVADWFQRNHLAAIFQICASMDDALDSARRFAGQ